MLDARIIFGRMTEERVKAQVDAEERHCEAIVARFDQLGREPTLEEREVRRLDFLASRKRLGELGSQLLTLRCPKA
jgi:hypothetical protein